MPTNRIPGQNDGAPVVGDSSAAFATGHSTGIEVLKELGVDSATVEEAAKGEKRRGGTNINDEETSPNGKVMTASEKVDNMEEIALYAIHVDDDPSLNPWTFRTWFLGILSLQHEATYSSIFTHKVFESVQGLGLSGFSATLATIYQFKPQGIVLTATFLCVISYVLALFMEWTIPRKGWVGRLLNPRPFNSKEHTAILIMSSTAAHSAMAVEVIAVQKLWYDKTPKAAVCIFLIFASQCLGYGIAGLLRKVLVYPTKFVFPSQLPIVSLLETLHRKKSDTKPQLKVFYWAFSLMFVWEIVPEYMMPILTAINVFCLAQRKSMVFTNIFGGGNGNEGLGLLSLCFDFQYIGSSALYLPLITQLNFLIGYILNIVVFLCIFYSNLWRARDFPFLSQLLFSPSSNNTQYVTYNQSAILDEHGVVDDGRLSQEGIPYMAATFASYVLTQNLAISATITHLILYNWDDLKSAWSFMSPENLKKLLKADTWKFWQQTPMTEQEEAQLDPHYRLMLRYKDLPDWWYGMIFLLAAVIGLVCIYQAESGMAWWAFIITTILASILILFTGAQSGLTGFNLPVQPIIQMIGAYLEPGKPVTNMYFTLFGYNSVSQGLLLLSDLKLGQYAKLSPRCTITMQMVGTLLGAILNYFIMLSITDSQREILLSVEGTHLWSGAGLQSFNTQAITWGGLAKHMYSWGSTYSWVPLSLVIGFFAPLPIYLLHRLRPEVGFDHLNVSIISWHIGWLCTGINSSLLAFFAVAFWSQYYLRRYKPDWFLKFNYVLCAGLDGGTQVIVFIMTFAFFGASGDPVPFPSYWGNKVEGNIDYCMTDPANG